MEMHHISPGICDNQGNSLVGMASKVGGYDLVKYFLDLGASPNVANVSTECQGSDRLLTVFSHFGIMQLEHGDTPLHLAFSFGHMDIFALLMQ